MSSDISSSQPLRADRLWCASLRGGPDVPFDAITPADLDRSDPESAIAAAAKRCSNWGRWGADDVLGTLNFLDEAKRREGAACVRRGASFSLSQRVDMKGPPKGRRRRAQPLHPMADTRAAPPPRQQGLPPRIRGRGDG